MIGCILLSTISAALLLPVPSSDATGRVFLAPATGTYFPRTIWHMWTRVKGRPGQGKNIPRLQLLIPSPQLTPGVLPLLLSADYKTVTLLSLSLPPAHRLGLSTHKPLAKPVPRMNNCVAMGLLRFFFLRPADILYQEHLCWALLGY